MATPVIANIQEVVKETSDKQYDSEDDVTLSDTPCDHTNLDKLQEWGSSYYSKNYLKTMKRFPLLCTACKCTFTGEKPTFKVNKSNHVYGCKNANDIYHVCEFCLCGTCYWAKKTQTKKRSRRSGVVLMPGEKLDANGNIYASV